MLLHELATASGCSAASIKYYRREGLLPAGERITTTRQDYGPRHLERLQLIQVLREIADAPIDRIRRLAELLDDPEVPRIRALEEAQAIALGAATVSGPAPTEGAGRAEHPSVAALLSRMDWPDIDSVPRRALDEVLHTLAGWEMPAGLETVMRYAVPMAEIARGDVEFMQGEPGNDGEISDDLVVLRAVAGTIAFDRLVQVLRALGHVSLSVQASESHRE
ncbi:MerR family transcriptional regulator [Brachybacterium sacelli]|uniref:DNA-binding transcriptional MerR regulator n=1 Tax=Brachybacterium sacelli TaxID=173364 RepID=A0ABS4WYG7_9MICO|nr:MerR family transcriptional regulator [Brachybacterium sacelli]MBP2381183.1 DNA-binding transcriptional MerR regulator [Brachybacterium sacelli]